MTAAHVFLAVGPGCWGRGDTPLMAVKNAASEGGYRRTRTDVTFRLYRVAPATQLVFDDWGSRGLQVPGQTPQSPGDCYVCDTDVQGRVLGVFP